MKSAIKKLKKAVTLFALSFLFGLPILFIAQAQDAAQPTEVEKVIEANKAAAESGTPSQENFVFGSTGSLQAAAFCFTAGNNSCYPAEAGSKPSAMESLNHAIVAMYSPPATTGEYIADLMNSAGIAIAKPAYAQGLGFSALNPILDTWKTFRNIAYLFYVVLFLVIGFMIMFRRKVNTQAAVTAQQALPNIVVSLITVTFSYAIAGLLIDLMYVVMFLIVGLFQIQFRGTSINLQDWAMNQNIFGIGIRIFETGITTGDSFSAVQNLVGAALKDTILDKLNLAGGISAASGVTFALIFSLAFLYGIFRLFFELLKTYVSIVISIVISPLALMLGALPGNNAFQSWIKSLVANLLVFPAVLVVIIFALILGGKSQAGMTGQSIGEGGFIPPYLIGYGSANAISTLLGLAIILILPDIVTQIKKSLGGGGGIFESLTNNFTSAISKGWKGDKLIPGLGFTDTSKWNVMGMTPGGISGSNLVSKAGVGAGAIAGTLYGGGRQMVRENRYDSKSFRRGMKGGLQRGVNVAANIFGDTTYKDKFKPKAEEKKPSSGGGNL